MPPTHPDHPSPMPDSAVQPPLVRAYGLCKSFGGVHVLRDAGVDLMPGEVHALVGENGAGKSTLAKIIGGVYTPDAGRLELSGQEVWLGSVRAARARGVALIHQEPLTFEGLTVAENIFIGRHPRRWGAVDWRGMKAQASRILEGLGVGLNPAMPVRGLSIADQQMVELAAALSQEARVLLMDETTAALTPREVQRLAEIIRHLKSRGAAIAFISHRMEEVFSICDKVTVLRDGQVVGSSSTADTSVDKILKQMVGRTTVIPLNRGAPRAVGPVAMEILDLGCKGRFEGVSFHVRCGQVVSLAGLVGAGRTEVVQALYGVRPPDSGRVELFGQPVRIRSPRQAVAHGLAMVPEDRQHHGVLTSAPVWQNATLTAMSRWSRWGWMRDRLAMNETARYVQRLCIRLRSLSQPIAQLSGGNQQKVVLAKALMTEPRIVILDEPTRGIDVGAKAEVHALILELASRGVAVLMVSSDLPEVLAVSDRILVMREGRLVAEYDHQKADADRIIAAATGATDPRGYAA